jgi:hypothetical protein
VLWSQIACQSVGRFQPDDTKEAALHPSRQALRTDAQVTGEHARDGTRKSEALIPTYKDRGQKKRFRRNSFPVRCAYMAILARMRGEQGSTPRAEELT